MRRPTTKKQIRYPDDLVVAAAILSTQGYSARQSARLLQRVAPAEQMSHNTVCRMLKQAVEDGYLQPRPTLDHAHLARDLYDAAMGLLLPVDASNSLARLPPKGHRFQMHVIRRDVSSDDALIEFGRVAAHLLLTELMDARVLGVAWGRVVNALVEGVAEEVRSPHAPSHGSRGPHEPTSVLPLCGEPLHVATSMHEFSSTVLATHLHESLNRDPTGETQAADTKGQGKSKVPSLAGVPAYLPGNVRRNGRDTLRHFFARVPSYAGFCGKRGLFQELDTIVSGVGVVMAPGSGRQGVFVSERVIAENTSYERLRTLAYGDLAGVLIPRPGLTATDLARVQNYNDGWTGISLQDLRRCARKAKRAGGVIVLANDPSKVELVREIVKQGLVNHLIIDVSLANALRA